MLASSVKYIMTLRQIIKSKFSLNRSARTFCCLKRTFCLISSHILYHIRLLSKYFINCTIDISFKERSVYNPSLARSRTIRSKSVAKIIRPIKFKYIYRHSFKKFTKQHWIHCFVKISKIRIPFFISQRL